jgi:hypothetical protein
LPRDILDIEAVDSFTYIGTELTKGNEEEVEIQKRIVSKQDTLFPITRHKVRTST